jgi:hypothetical protein
VSPPGRPCVVSLTARHDFYQTDAHVIVSIYIKGYGAPEVKDQVKVSFEAVKASRTQHMYDNGEDELMPDRSPWSCPSSMTTGKHSGSSSTRCSLPSTRNSLPSVFLEQK